MNTNATIYRAWTVMSIPGDDLTPTNWYAYNRDTLSQVRCDDFDEASRIVEEMNNAK